MVGRALLSWRAIVRHTMRAKKKTDTSALIAIAEALAAQRPRCHKTTSDLAAVVFIIKLHARGFDVSLGDAEGCIDRMRIAVQSGIYPDELLAQAGPKAPLEC